MGFDSTRDFILPPTVLLGFSFAIGCGVSFFVGIQHSPVNGCLAVNWNFGVLTGEDECMFFYYAIWFVPHVVPYISVIKAVPGFKHQLSFNCL